MSIGQNPKNIGRKEYINFNVKKSYYAGCDKKNGRDGRI